MILGGRQRTTIGCAPATVQILVRDLVYGELGIGLGVGSHLECRIEARAQRVWIVCAGGDKQGTVAPNQAPAILKYVTGPSAWHGAVDRVQRAVEGKDNAVKRQSP